MNPDPGWTSPLIPPEEPEPWWILWAVGLTLVTTLVLILSPMFGCNPQDDDDNSPTATPEPSPSPTVAGDDTGEPSPIPTPYPQDYVSPVIITPCEIVLQVYLARGGEPPPGCIGAPIVPTDGQE